MHKKWYHKNLRAYLSMNEFLSTNQRMTKMDAGYQQEQSQNSNQKKIYSHVLERNTRIH